MKRIIMDFSQEHIRTALVDGDELVEVMIDDPAEPHIAGNIYAGIVKRVLPNGFAFVDIGKDDQVFMDLNAQKGNKPKQGGRVLVQITRAGHDGKAALATTELCFAGRYAVVFASPLAAVGVSRKIRKASDRRRLKKLAAKLLPEGCGAIVRTGASSAQDSDFADEIHSLAALSKKITNYGKHAKAPSAVYEKRHLLHGTLQTLMNETIDEVVVNAPHEQQALQDVLTALGFDGALVKQSDAADLFAHFGIAESFERAFDKRVWLPSGGHVVIEKTEACIVIDVNTGKSTRRAAQFTTNCEAATEIARQLRLRNLSGIIIIDFISMTKTDEKRKVQQILKQAVRDDRVRVNVVGMTKLGLMQLTRQRTGKTLEQ